MKKLKKIIIPVVLIFLSLLIFRYILSVDKEYNIPQMPTGSNFSFEKNGKSIELSDFKGKVVALYFGFTFCPDVCPSMLSTLSSIYKKLDEAQKRDFQIIFITVDPQRDNQKKIDDYTHFFEPSIVALRGNVQHTKRVAKSFGVNFSKYYPQKDSKNYVIDHTTYAILLDRNNEISEFIPHDESGDVIEKLILKELKDKK